MAHAENVIKTLNHFKEWAEIKDIRIKLTNLIF
jgi:hypothetical protein